MCSLCGVENKADDPINLFSDDELDQIILAIWIGAINVNNLDLNTYQKIARKLSEGVFEGFGKDMESVLYESEDYFMLKALRENIYIFSGAKTYQQTREIEAVLEELSRSLTHDNQVTTFAEFKKRAKEILVDYNENYLRTEYQSAIAQSRSASMWMEFEKAANTLGCLKYHTVGDARVRPTHAELDGIVRPLGDKFWDSYFPPNGWNCRCTVLQVECGEEPQTDLRGFKKPKDVPDIFMFNAGKQRIVFSHKHPYFDVADNDKDWAQENFGLPLPT